MALRYCFESAYIARTLAKCKKNDLAVIDTEGHKLSVKEAVKRGVWVYGCLNVGYEDFHHIRLAKYSGWDGEYWINPTAKEWQEHYYPLNNNYIY